MPPRIITNWDDAYANGAHIVGGADYPAKWSAAAAAFRDTLSRAGRAELDIAYGPEERQRYDLFLPAGSPRGGLFVYVHGGYWMRFDKSGWSHLAAGPLAHGYAVAMPSYTLCPRNSVSGITAEIGAAIETVAARVAGPIMLAGHSAGGHLVSRMACKGSPLDRSVQARVRHVLSISGVHDLRPLLRTGMNATLKLDEAEAHAESPALLEPVEGIRLTCWAGAAERGEFIRQNALLANVWAGLGAATEAVEEPDRHHFNVVDALGDTEHAMTRLVCAGA